MANNLQSLKTLDDHSTAIAEHGISPKGGDLHSWCVRLYKHRDGKWYTREFGGDAMSPDNNPTWLTREQAVEFVATKAIDPVTGWGYSTEQAEAMVDGEDAGRGYRRE